MDAKPRAIGGGFIGIDIIGIDMDAKPRAIGGGFIGIDIIGIDSAGGDISALVSKSIIEPDRR